MKLYQIYKKLTKEKKTQVISPLKLKTAIKNSYNPQRSQLKTVLKTRPNT